MKEGQKFKLIKWNKQLISVVAGILLASQLAVGSVQVLADTKDNGAQNNSEKIGNSTSSILGLSGVSLLKEQSESLSEDSTGKIQVLSDNEAGVRGGIISPQVENNNIQNQADLEEAILEAPTGTSDAPTELTLTASFAIDDHYVAISGKHIKIQSTTGVTLTRTTSFTGNFFNVTNNGSLTIENLTIDGENVDGGSLIIVNNSEFTLTSGNLINGNANYGGAINAIGTSKININGGTISRNSSSSNGGGIFISGTNSEINISGGTISGNIAGGQAIGGPSGQVPGGPGGGVYLEELNAIGNSSFNMDGGTISSNGAGSGGGIIAIGNGTVDVKITGGKISNNVATTFGGGINAGTINGTLSITGGIVSNNSASRGGGSIYSSGYLDVSGGVIYGAAASVAELVFAEDDTWTGPTGDGVAIANTSPSPYTWQSAEGLVTQKGDNVQNEPSLSWTIQDDSVGVDYDYTDSDAQRTGFIPVEDAQIKLEAAMFEGILPENYPMAYTGKEITSPAIPITTASTYLGTTLADRISKEVVSTYQHQTIFDENQNKLFNVGTYDVSASVTTATEPTTKLLNGSVEIGTVIVKEAQPDASYYTANISDKHVYSGAFPSIQIDKASAYENEDIGDITTVFKQGTEEATTANIGVYDVYARNAGSDKYASVDVKIGEIEITAAPLTITAADASAKMGGSLPEGSIQYAGFVANENEGTIFSQLPTIEFSGDTTKVGTSEIKVVAGTTNARGNNYQITYKSGTLTVEASDPGPNPDPEPIAPDATLYDAVIPSNQVYDGTIPEITITSKGEDVGEISTVIKQNDVEVTSPNVGTYQVYARNTGSDDYLAADTLLGEFKITERSLTITAENIEVLQGATLPTATINYSGFADGEDADTIFSELPTGTFTGDSSTVGTSTIEVTPGTENEAANNYEISYVAGTLTVTENGSGGEEEDQDRLPVYRVYNPNNGEHLYTLSQAEARWLIDDIGLNDEGISWHAGEKTGKAVYRLYNQNSGEHFYTLDQGEYESVGRAGWTQEGIAFYAAEDTEIPIYRVFNPNSQDAGSHHYTLSTTENTWLIRQGWKSEGIGFYGK